MFDAIATASGVSKDTIANIATMAGLSAAITTILNSITNMDTTVPTGLLTIGSVSISPKVEMPTLPGFRNPQEDIVSDPFSAGLDPCHLDLGIFGSILKALMLAVSTIITTAIDAIVSAVRECIDMFLVLCETISAVGEWLSLVIENTWTKMKETYNSFFDNKMAAKEQKDNIKEKLWERALKWLEDLMGKIGILIGDLKTKVSDFIKMLDTILDTMKTKVGLLIEQIGKLPGDVACIMKQATDAIKVV